MAAAARALLTGVDDDYDEAATDLGEDEARRLLDRHVARLERASGAEPGSFRCADNRGAAAGGAEEDEERRTYVASLDATQLYASTLGASSSSS